MPNRTFSVCAFLISIAVLSLSTNLLAESSKLRLEEEALNDLEFRVTPLLNDLGPLETSTVTLSNENLEHIRSVANRLGMLMARLDINYSAKEFSQMLMKGTEKSGVNAGLIVPMIQIMDRSLGNNEKGIANLINPLIGELNPRIGAFLNHRLGLQTRLPDRGEGDSSNSKDGRGDTNHSSPETPASRGYEGGIGRGSDAAFAFELRIEKSLNRLFNKGAAGKVTFGGGPFLEVNRRHTSKDEQLSMSFGCIADISWNIAMHAGKGAVEGARAGGLAGPKGAVAGGIAGGVAGAAYGAMKGSESKNCDVPKKEEKAEPAKPESKSKEPPKDKPKDEPKDEPKEKPAPVNKPELVNNTGEKPEKKPKDGHVRPADGAEGASVPLTPAENAKREQEKQAQERRKRERLINYPPDYDTYTPEEKQSFEEEQRRKMAPRISPRDNFEDKGPSIANDELLRRRMVPLIYITN